MSGRLPGGIAFAGAIFISAFLLFQVQPLISKCILPWFGGTPAVWTTCMLFFQTVLFAGYLYAHLTTRYLRPRAQGLFHVALLLAGVLCLPIVPDAAWKPAGDEEPVTRILLMLAATVGLPFFLLSSTGPLLQRWFSRTQPDQSSVGARSPYRLYALSNLGSLLALVSYPFVFEPALATHSQAVLWSWGFALFAGVCTLCAALVFRRAKSSSDDDDRATDCELASTAAPTTFTRLLWFGLAMCASVMLLATTNQVCMDVASVPFLWVLPLTLYLVSFILCFDGERWYSRRVYALAFAVSTAGVTVVMLKGAGGSLMAQVGVYLAGLFFCAMVCHGELARLKPHPQFLTSFYLLISAGGAAGGLFVGLVAPLVFPAYLELHVGILGSVLLAVVVYFRVSARSHQGSTRSHQRSRGSHYVSPRCIHRGLNCIHRGLKRRGLWKWAAAAVGIGVLAVGLTLEASQSLRGAIAVGRNFYGVLRVKEEERENPSQCHRTLMHGRIVHGLQFSAPEKRLRPTAYYGRRSGIGRILSRRPENRPLRVGVVGLGVGTLAVYGRSGDCFRFYEINPEVVDFAKRYFTFLQESPAKCDVVPGDARLSLQRQPPQQFDVLVLDAFSGDAVPAHLLTREAGAIYLRHLKADGVLAVHISNLHFDLRPVVNGLADHYKLAATTVFSAGNPDLGTKHSLWMLLARDADAVELGELEAVPLAANDSRLLWTDDRSNLFEILR